MENTCICCGRVIPEGRLSCPFCDNALTCYFEVNGKPLGKQRPRVTVINGHGRAYTPAQTVSYENYIKINYLQHKQPELFNKPLMVVLTAVYGIPKAMSKKDKLKALQGTLSPQTKPDLDNIAKIYLDALNGIAYADDKQVVELKVKKVFGDTPKVKVLIKEISYDN